MAGHLHIIGAHQAGARWVDRVDRRQHWDSAFRVSRRAAQEEVLAALRLPASRDAGSVDMAHACPALLRGVCFS